MLNKLLTMLRSYEMLQPGDRVYCAVSGGADSMALLWGLYLLKEKLQITLLAAHFNHQLREAESDRDEAFVQAFCDRLDIPLTVGRGRVVAGEKGLEAAARDARYSFLQSLPGKIATAHTANDNAETVLMHMVRGTGLRGLGGIAPVRGKLIRPLLSVTREELLEFLAEYHVSYVEDSTNAGDLFLRNRLRHRVMPLLEQENPRLAENLSAMALRLREDEAELAAQAQADANLPVSLLRQLSSARKSRALDAFLKRNGVREPEAAHIRLLEGLVNSSKPSARASFPGVGVISRSYDTLQLQPEPAVWQPQRLLCPGVTELPQLGLRFRCTQAAEVGSSTAHTFWVFPTGQLWVRSRQPGDCITLPGGTKSLKKLLIDRKIPAWQRELIPVICDDQGILGVYGIGINRARETGSGPCIQVQAEPI